MTKLYDSFIKQSAYPHQSVKLTDAVRSVLSGIGTESDWAVRQILGRPAPKVANLKWKNRTASMWDHDNLISYHYNEAAEGVYLQQRDANDGEYNTLGVYNDVKEAKQAAMQHYRREYAKDVAYSNDDVRNAMRSDKPGTIEIRPISAPVELEGGRIAVKLGYNNFYGSPATDDIQHHVGHYYAGHDIEHYGDNFNGVISLILKESQMDMGNLPAGSDPSTKRGPGVGEELEGTTMDPQSVTAQSDPGALFTHINAAPEGEKPHAACGSVNARRYVTAESVLFGNKEGTFPGNMCWDCYDTMEKQNKAAQQAPENKFRILDDLTYTKDWGDLRNIADEILPGDSEEEITDFKTFWSFGIAEEGIQETLMFRGPFEEVYQRISALPSIEDLDGPEVPKQAQQMPPGGPNEQAPQEPQGDPNVPAMPEGDATALPGQEPPQDPSDSMTLEEALSQLESATQQATDAANAVKTKVEQGDAVLHGQEVEMVDEAPQAGIPTQPAAPAGAQPVVAQFGGQNRMDPDWVRKQREQELLEKARATTQKRLEKMDKLVKQRERVPTTEVPKRLEDIDPNKPDKQIGTPEEQMWFDLDKIFYAEWPGRSNIKQQEGGGLKGGPNAGMRKGYERIPAGIYSKLVAVGAPTRRGYYKKDPVTGEKYWVKSTLPKWDVLTPEELETARSVMEEDYNDYKEMTRSIMRGKGDSGRGKTPKGPVVHKKSVDEEAKDYYEDYYGDYGVSMTQGKAAQLAEDAIEIAASNGKSVDEDTLARMISFVARRPLVHGSFMSYLANHDKESDEDMVRKVMELSQSNPEVARRLDRITLDYLINNSGALDSMSPEDQTRLLWRAIRSGKYRKRLNNLWQRAMGVPDAPEQAQPQITPEIEHMAFKLTAAGFKEPKVNKGLDDAVDLVKMEDVAEDYDGVPPGHIPMTHSKPSQRGGYVVMTVTWEPDDVKVGGQSLLHSIENYVKGVSSHREFTDFGFIGSVHIDDIDPKAGSAVVRFKAKGGAGGAVQEVKSTSKESK